MKKPKTKKQTTTAPTISPDMSSVGPTSGPIVIPVTGTPYLVPLFPFVCDCGVELRDFDEAAAHDCASA